MNNSKPPAVPAPLLDVESSVTYDLIPMTDGGSTTKKPFRLYPEAFDGCSQPKQLWTSRRIGNKEVVLQNQKRVKGVLHVCGRGSKTANVMFVSGCVYREEELTTFTSKPSLLNGPAGNLFLRSLYRCGIPEEDWFYTSVVKYNVPKLKPSSADIRWCSQMLKDEIETIKPKLIVCLGKTAFDVLFKLKLKMKDIQGGFFDCPEFGCALFPMDSLLTPLMKPEFLERQIVDLKEVKKFLDEIKGISRIKVATEYTTIDTSEKLQNLMTYLGDEVKSDRLHMASIDSEWHGQTAWSGQLRAFQMSWKPGKAAYVRLTAPVNGKSIYVMDQPLPVIREIIKPVMNNPALKWIGHNAHADMAWMDQHLELDVFDRFGFDTMFAQQLLNEYADLKLERCSVQYTDLGRYDIDLLLWKKKTKFDEEDNEGYGLVPDEILIPYACRDVDCTIRIYPILMKQLIQQKLSTYYFNYTLPFVTNGFYELMSTGIPIEKEYLDEMREMFTHHGAVLLTEFRKTVKQEANVLLHSALRERSVTLYGSPDQGTKAFFEMSKLARRGSEVEKELRQQLQSFASDSTEFAQLLPLYMHWRECDQFNISSTDHLRRWLYDVKKFRPIKTTKKDGIQMAWDKVMNLTPDKRRQYTPAADKQTIKVFAARDPLVAQIEELKAVQNITKIFLKGPDEEGREQGLHKWIQPDGRIHTNWALAETSRTRTWKPNILNWPKAITKPIEKAFERINILVADTKRKELQLRNASDEEVAKAVNELITRPISLRSAAKAPEGCVLIDMDLKTAEVVALAYLSGDENMIKVLTEPDSQFARIDKDNPKKAVRICYNDNVGLPESEQDQSVLVPMDDPRILRDACGEILHPLRDIHWEMAEEVANKPREKLEERLYRDGAGKVGNFSIPYGAASTLLERMIEANTGIKPPEGTGQKMLDTHATRYPQATEFQKEMEECIQDPGFYRSISGRVRHFFYTNLGDVDGLSDYTMEGILSPLKRQARNFPMQELVAATATRALIRFIKERRERGFNSRIMMSLYDAVTSISTFEQAKETVEVLRNCLTVWCPWTVHGRTFNFDVDTSIGFRWGVKTSKEEKELVKNIYDRTTIG